MTTLHDFHATTLTGGDQDFAEFAGHPVLIVNTASECGLTPHYEGLQQLADTFGDRGLVVVGFPCNQFGAQEPGTAEEISEFCRTRYDVRFPMMAKVDVNGSDAHPVWEWLRAESGGDDIEWNFAKFLVDGQGALVKRWAPQTEPSALSDDIEAALT